MHSTSSWVHMHPVDLESHGILFCHFPGLESPGKKTTGMESPGNSLKSSYKILRIYKKKIFQMARRIDLQN